jgi:hypothetical protein
MIIFMFFWPKKQNDPYMQPMQPMPYSPYSPYMQPIQPM